MNKFLIILIICNILPKYFFAQIGVLKVLELPEKYIVADELTNLLPDPGNIIAGRAWAVYSDRDNNQTFRSPKKNAKELMSGIPFLEKFYVIDETDEYLHIVKENKLSKKLTVGRASRDYGWIPKSRLLIWEHCLVSANNKSFQRVLFYSTGQYADVHLHTSPDLNHITSHSVALNAPTVLYVYKENPESMLVGTSIKIDHLANDNYAIGWISNLSVLKWNYPLCIEANWESEAIEERLRKHIEPAVFTSVKKLKKFQNGRPLKKYLWKGNNNELMDYGRPEGEFFRFPILKQSDEMIQVLLTDNSLPDVFGEIGYAPRNIRGLNHPVFRSVLLMSRLELGKIIIDYNKLISAYRREKATGVQQTFLQLLKTKIPNASDDYLLSLSIAKVTQKLYGAASESDFANLKLHHLINYAREEPGIMNMYMNKLAANADFLEVLYNSEYYKYSFSMFNEIYYWISVSELP